MTLAPVVIYHDKLLQQFYDIGPWGQCYKTIAVIFHDKLLQ